ncbi:MAG TPA: MarR family winged helix-turn-helix transcriptional regulator [Candidatus Edwardsbacteria bacterium]|nr:MarR family winged helix-turn-helix transcriptional regulator [Candidatus Edwardsbacteria bacterium]
MGLKYRQNGWCDRLAAVAGLRQRIWDREAARRGLGDASWAQGELVAAVEKEGGRLQVQDLAEKTGRGKSTASALVAKLCRRGLVFKMKVSGDGRGAWVVLTEKGKRMSQAWSQTSAMVDRRCWGGFSARERQWTEQMLTRIEKNLNREGGKL